MKEILHNSWQQVLEKEFTKPYYLQLREFLKHEYKLKLFYPDMYRILPRWS